MKTCDECVMKNTDGCPTGNNSCENFLEESKEWKINKEKYTWNLILALANCVLTDEQKREILKMAEKQSTNKDKLIDLPSEDLYDKMVWLFQDYGRRFADSRTAIIEWLNSEGSEDKK